MRRLRCQVILAGVLACQQARLFGHAHQLACVDLFQVILVSLRNALVPHVLIGQQNGLRLVRPQRLHGVAGRSRTGSTVAGSSGWDRFGGLTV